jgi:hypothetical protein
LSSEKLSRGHQRESAVREQFEAAKESGGGIHLYHSMLPISKTFLRFFDDEPRKFSPMDLLGIPKTSEGFY